MASTSRIATRLPLEMLYHWERQCPDRIYLRQTINREYVDFTWGEVADEARRMVTALRALGLVAGDKVALLSKNCAEWFIADLAMQMGQYVSVPIYPTANVDTIEYVLRHSEAKAIFVGKLDDWKSQEAGVPGDLLRIALPYDTMPAAHQWDDLLAQYDSQIHDYYLARSSNNKVQTWSGQIKAILGKEARPFMLGFLQSKGFCLK